MTTLDDLDKLLTQYVRVAVGAGLTGHMKRQLAQRWLAINPEPPGRTCPCGIARKDCEYHR